ncbi:hypothetical protein K435DRAFT_615422, partial [Dendrothele bispora CBS 962.96]
YIPSPSEHVRIRARVEEIEIAWSKCDREIQWLEEAADKLRRQKAYLERCAGEHKSLLSPIRLLPPEILSQIFEY